MSFALHGIGVSGGIAIGRAQLVSHATREVAHYTIPLAQVASEIERFETAIAEVQRELEGLHAALTSGDAPGEFGAFLDVHWMILNDPTLSEAPKRIIAEQRDPVRDQAQGRAPRSHPHRSSRRASHAST